MSLSIGDSVPIFYLKDQQGSVFKIENIIGKKPFVIYFYPKDFTPGCTKEACSFRDSYQDFQELGAEVIGISGDNEQKHGRFALKHKLPFILLSDTEGKTRKKFQVKAGLFGFLPGRETFVFDSMGKLIMKYNNIKSSGHTQKALNTIKNLKHDN